MRSRLAAVLGVLTLVGCPTSSNTDGGAQPGPIVTSISPSHGPTTGGTLVTILGANFSSAARVRFASAAATEVFVISPTSLTAIAPAGMSPGPVDVTVLNDDGKSNVLSAGFTYEGQATTVTIGGAYLTFPATAADSSGAATVMLAVTGQVEAGTVTKGAGQGAGIRAQVGFATTVSATPTASDFTWTDAAYLGDADGATPGDLARDSYSGAVRLPGATSASPVSYTLAVRFSGDSGATWTIGDRDGSGNGLQASQLSVITVVKPAIDWCKLGGEAVQAPPMIALRGTATGPVIYGQVYKANVTSVAGASSQISGQLGSGAPGTDPAGWTWVDATWNRDSGNGANDEYQATLPNPGPGTFEFAFRFTANGGPWTYCDADGTSTGGFTDAEAGTLTVTPVGIDRCVLQFPPTLDTRTGRPSALTYGRVFAQGVTDVVGAGAGIEGQVGYGPVGVAPSDPAWAWSAGTFNVDVTAGGGDEYQASLTGPAPGTYAYAWRFRYQQGAWAYCDQDGSDNGFQAAQAGAITALPFAIDECVLDATTASQTALVGTSSAPYQAAITVTTLTEAAGQGSGVTVQVASGPAGSDPTTWTGWTAASYQSDQGNADVYAGTVTAPGLASTVDVAFRAELGSGAFVYCDKDGAANGYQVAQAGRLVAVGSVVTACRLETVSSSSIHSGDPLRVTASVAGTNTQTTGATPGLQVQVGVGPQGADGSSSPLFGWGAMTFTQDAAGRDVFAATVLPAYTGNRTVSARASFDGVTWTYCDLNGSDVNGYEVTQQYDVAVAPHVDLAFCNTQFPATISVGALDGGLADAYGQVYEPSLTPNANGTGVSAQFGAGPEQQDPGVAWTWEPAPFSSTVGNNNEYKVSWKPDGGGLSYAFRYTRDGGVFCYGDLDGTGRNGSGGGFTGGANLGTVVP